MLLFVNRGLPPIKICMKKPLVKMHFHKFAQFTKFTKVSRLRKFLVLQYCRLGGSRIKIFFFIPLPPMPTKPRSDCAPCCGRDKCSCSRVQAPRRLCGLASRAALRHVVSHATAASLQDVQTGRAGTEPFGPTEEFEQTCRPQYLIRSTPLCRE